MVDPEDTVDPGGPEDTLDTGPAPGRRVAAVALAVVAVTWACVLVLVVGVLVAEAITLDDRTCAVPGVPAAEAEVTWQWWPPGAVCSLGGQRLSEPAAARGWAIPGLVVVGIGLVVLSRRQRDRPEPDRVG
jgi:hypothetical protein